MMKDQPRIRISILLRIVLAWGFWLGLLAGWDGSAVAQENPSEVDALARTLAAQLVKSHIKSVVLFDLRGPHGQRLPFGGWLADQISGALANRENRVEVIDRGRLSSMLDSQHLSLQDELLPDVAARIAASLGADAFIEGSFGAIGNGIGITLVATRVSSVKPGKLAHSFAMVNGGMSVDNEVATHLGVALESLRPSDGVYTSGSAGVTDPQCEYCPSPDFSPTAMPARMMGTIVVGLVVSPEGRATQLKVLQSAGTELDNQAIKAAASYRFKPALGPDGKPVAVRMLFSWTYHF